MNITTSDIKIYECKLLGTKSSKLVNALKQIDIAHFLGFYKQLKKKKQKKKCARIDGDLLKYLKNIQLHKKELHYMVNYKFKDSVTVLKTILEEIKN